MMTGMLWHDNDQSTSFDEKIKKAVNYYRNKYGVNPNLVLVNPGALAQQGVDEYQAFDGLTVRGYRSVMPGHLWIGIEGEVKVGKHK